MNTTDLIIRYEQGDLTQEETADLFQALVDSGLAWQLQGSYGRTAVGMLAAGIIVDRVRERRDQRSGLPETAFRKRGPAHPPGFRPIGGGR